MLKLIMSAARKIGRKHVVDLFGTGECEPGSLHGEGRIWGEVGEYSGEVFGVDGLEVAGWEGGEDLACEGWHFCG